MIYQPLFPFSVLLPVALLVVAGCVVLAVLVPRRRLAWVVRALAICLLAVAFVRPSFPLTAIAHTAESEVDVFLVVDTSASMVAEDWENGAPRLDGVKEDMDALVAQLPGARFSMITFDSSAAVRVPLTTDAAAIGSAIDTLKPEPTTYSGGSSITAFADELGDRLQKAEEQNPQNGRLVYYFGDGEQTSEDAPLDVSGLGGSIDGGAVFGYGTGQGGRMKETVLTLYADEEEPEYIQDPATGTDALSRIDEGALQDLANEFGTDYVHRTAAVPFDTAYTAPAFESHLVEKETAAGYREFFWIPLIGFFAWVVFEAVLATRRIRELTKLHTTLASGGAR
ncbi:vWA domain-containing protein [Brevibacterium samyangense]|uniref:VWA domain-containing protein n=1 Tax=Brevibacterium samyangense TaxID=366888 RepID=A0ABP5F1X6_9MICO